jgi:transmembrane sensor
MLPAVDSRSPDQIPASVMEELIAWSVKLSSGSASAKDEEHFLQWRAQDPIHEAAWQKLHAMEQELVAVPVNKRPIVTQTMALMEKHSRTTKQKQAFKQIGLLTGVAVCTLAFVLGQVGPWHQQTHLATTIGERSTFTLSDGTQLTLNTNTSVDVHYALLKREIVLNAGEIYLETGKDTQGLFGRRSFWVNTKQTKLEAIGTKFSVYQKEENTRLHVTEGIVALHTGKHTPVRAYANESYSAQGTALPMRTESQQEPMAWLDGVIVAKQMRLDELMAELTRYQTLSVRFSSDTAGLQVSGVFQLNIKQPAEHALNTIAQTLPIRVTKQNDHFLIRKK